jgi:hypothetical protein
MKLDKTEATIRGLQNSIVQLEERTKKLQSDCEKHRLPFPSLCGRIDCVSADIPSRTFPEHSCARACSPACKCAIKYVLILVLSKGL